jgi:hemerythrin-like domain-containing protein
MTINTAVASAGSHDKTQGPLKHNSVFTHIGPGIFEFMNQCINKPIARSEQLSPLSREHHDGLLLVWKLRQGLANATPVDTLRDFCSWYWKQHIKSHFNQEEKILFPLLPAGEGMAIQLKKEHDDIRDLLIAIDHEPCKTLFGLLASFLEHHIRFEERVAYPQLERTLTPKQLNSVFQQLKARPFRSPGWKEEFWTRVTH